MAEEGIVGWPGVGAAGETGGGAGAGGAAGEGSGGVVRAGLTVGGAVGTAVGPGIVKPCRHLGQRAACPAFSSGTLSFWPQ